jgi:hypothetical protein
MLGYGMAKTFTTGNQFAPPDVSQLLKTYGDSSPMNLVWTMMGTSRAYTFFAGSGEVVGGLLLLWRRTTTVGALVTFGVMANVVMLNFCYDVPVKLYSTHLTVMAVFLFVADAPRLANLLFWNRARGPVALGPPYVNAYTVWLQRLVKAYLIVVGVALPFYYRFRMDMESAVATQQAPDWFGTYEVEEFQRDGDVVPPLVGDPERWRRITLRRVPWGPSDMMAIERMDGSRLGGQCIVAPDENSFACPMISTANWNVDREDDGRVRFTTTFDGRSISVRLRPLRREDFQLINRGFHWINEFPFNR